MLWLINDSYYEGNHKTKGCHPELVSGSNSFCVN